MVNILKVKTTQSNIIKILFEALKDVMVDVPITFTPHRVIIDEDGDEVSTGGMSITQVNRRKTLIISLQLNADEFEEFYCARDQLSLGINIENFYKLIKTIDSDTNITLLHDDTNINKLIIITENGKKTVTNKLSLLDLDAKGITLSEPEPDSTITMKTVDFHKTCRNMYNISNKIEIKNTKDALIFFAKSPTIECETKFNPSDENELKIKMENEDNIIQGVFPLKSLIIFNKFTSLHNKMYIYYKNDYPIVLHYPVSSLGKISIIIAQEKVDNESLKKNDSDDEFNEDDISDISDEDDEVDEDDIVDE